MPDTPRPIQHLADLMHRYPDLPAQVDHLRAGKGGDLPDWPDWCFVPFAGWHALATRDATPETYFDRIGDVAVLGALAPWRYTQGIYRFDPDLLEALTSTPLDNILPAGVFLRLPQWSIYIELPAGYAWQGNALYGFWASLEWDAGEHYGRHELRLLMDTAAGLNTGILHLGPWTVIEAMRRTVAEMEHNNEALHLGAQIPPTLAGSMAADIAPLLSILLYLCADEPEVDNDREPGQSPHNASPKRVKGGVRLFPPAKPTIWQVGAQIGAQLRAAQTAQPTEAAEAGHHRSPRTHVRRGHWHGYWTGPRNAPDARGFVYHWLPPQVVGGSQ